MLCFWRGSSVSGLKKCFRHEPQNVVVLGEVEEPVTVASNGDEVSQPKLGEMLRNSSRCDTNMFGKIVDRVLAMKQRPDDMQPRSVSEQLQGFGRRVEFRR